MSRSLAVVAGVGIATSVVCLALAGMLSPYQGVSFPFSSHRSYGPGWWGGRHWDGAMPFVESGDVVTREFKWNGWTRADSYIPGTVYYQPGPEWRVTVKGPQSSVDHLRIEDGQILFDASMVYPQSSTLEVRITGPSLESFGLKGSGALVLENIAQKHLDINLFGSGSVRGRGAVENLELKAFGSGNAELGELATVDLDISMFGSGNVEVAPTGNVEVSSFGSGDVRLRTKPRHLSTKMIGSGRLIQQDSGRESPEDTNVDAPMSPQSAPIEI